MGVESRSAPSPVKSIEKWPKLIMPSSGSGLPNPATPGIPEGAERKVFDSPNVRKLKGLIHDFQQASAVPDQIKPEDLDPKWAEVGIKALDLSHPVNNAQNFSKSLEFVRSLVKSENSEDRSQVPDTGAMLSDYKSLTLYLEDLQRKVNANPLLGDKKMFSEMKNNILERYKNEAARRIAAEGGILFEEDAVSTSGLPLEIRNEPEEHTDPESNFIPSLKRLATASSDPELKKAYVQNLQELDARLPASLDPEKADQELFLAAADVIRNYRYQYWGALDPTPNESSKLYDLLNKQLFDALYRGGYESWDGTAAAGFLSKMKDPRALPGLVLHLRMNGSGHTSASVSSVIFDIAKHSNFPERLPEVVESSSQNPVIQKILKEWVLSPDPEIQKLLNKMDGYSFARVVKSAESHFAFSTLLSLAIQLARKKGEEIDEVGAANFFNGFFGEAYGTDNINKLLLSADSKEVAQVIGTSRNPNWQDSAPAVFNHVVNPPDKNYLLLPKIIAGEALNLDPEYVKKLEALYGSKDLQTGSLARRFIAEGMLYLSSKSDGKEIMESLLNGLNLTEANGQLRVANADPERVRAIFRMMQTLDNFGEYEFTSKPTLAEIVANLREKTVVAVVNKMELAEDDMPSVSEKLQYILESGLADIIPTLLANSSYPNVAQVTREIGRHIILGDFKDWRNNLETSQAQLTALPEDKRAAWLSPVPEVRLKINVSEDSELRRAAAESVQDIAKQAKAHILEVYKLEFSPDRLRQLKMESDMIVKSLKADTDPDQKKELGVRKRTIDQEARIVEGILGLETLDQKDLNPEKLIESVEKIIVALKAFQGLEQPANDLEQIGKVLTTQQTLKTVSEVRAYDSDDPLSLLKLGVEPTETCQSWRRGGYNYCLASNSSDANKRVINVENDRGEVVARSIIKLTHIREGENSVPAILVEPIYSTSNLSQIYKGIVDIALEKAKATGAVLLLKNEIVAYTGADHSRTIPLLRNEAAKKGFEVSSQQAEVFIPQSYNQYEYSDTLGGVVSYFERYQPGGFTVVRPAAA